MSFAPNIFGDIFRLCYNLRVKIYFLDKNVNLKTFIANNILNKDCDL